MIKITQWKKKLIGVLGLGKTGVSTIDALIAGGADVIAWDDNPNNMKSVSFAQSSHLLQLRLISPQEEDWRNMSALVVSPGIPMYYPTQHTAYLNALKYNVPMISDIELLQQAQPDASYIGVTGTNGKSTTTALIAHIFRGVGRKAEECGNIGNAVLSATPFYNKDEYYIIEASSFQLDLLDKMRFDISICLNITPDHLDRHGSLVRYIQAKSKIFSNQTMQDYAIISTNHQNNNALLNSLVTSQANLIKISSSDILKGGISVMHHVLHDDYFTKKSYLLESMPALQGEHNAENIAAAFAAASAANVNAAEIIEALKSFKALPHRMELVHVCGNLRFVNDSKATNIESAYCALETFSEIYWIAGGRSKTNDWEKLVPLFKNIKHAYLIGEAAPEIANMLELHGVAHSITHTIEDAVQLIKNHNIGAGTILLSPACSSLDQWRNFEERGDSFVQLVKEYWRDT